MQRENLNLINDHVMEKHTNIWHNLNFRVFVVRKTDPDSTNKMPFLHTLLKLLKLNPLKGQCHENLVLTEAVGF